MGSWYSASSPKPQSDSAQTGRPPLGRRGAGSAPSGAGVWAARGGGEGPEDAGGPHFRSDSGHQPRRPAQWSLPGRPRTGARSRRPPSPGPHLLREASGPARSARAVAGRLPLGLSRGLARPLDLGRGGRRLFLLLLLYLLLGARGGDSRPGAASRPERTPTALPSRSAPPAPPAAAAAAPSGNAFLPRRVSRWPRRAGGGGRKPEAGTKERPAAGAGSRLAGPARCLSFLCRAEGVG